MPLACLDGLSPNAMIKSGDYIDARWQYRFAFGDLVCFHIDKIHRTWKFDTRNEVGFYMGDKKGVKGAVWVYRPYRHDRLLRDDVHRIPVSDVQLLMWYGRREEVRQAGLPFKVVRDAYINLLPSDQFEERQDAIGDRGNQGQKRGESKSRRKRGEEHEGIEDDAHDDSGESDKEPMTDDDGGQNPYDTIVLPVETKPFPPGTQTRSKTSPGPRRYWGNEKSRKGRETIDNGARQARSAEERRSRTKPNVNATKTPLEILDEAMERVMVTDEYIKQEARIINIYRMLSMMDPDMPDTDESVDTREALIGPYKEQFLEAILSEWLNLCKATIEKISQQQLDDYEARGGNYEKIGLTMKVKMKLKPDGSFDKFKGRGAGRGDQWVRQRLKKGKPLPKTFSPTVKPLTFAWVQQLATIKKMFKSTEDVKLAYLNCIYPDDADWIVVYLEPWIADALGLDRDQLYRVRRYIYGLPEAGRAFYELFSSKLIEEGYGKSEMDPCLFYRIQGGEETYVVIFVDDSFIYSNRLENIHEYESKLRKHFDITSDPTAESFLGITFTYDEKGDCKLSQKKLMTKLLKENPPLKHGKRWQPPTHPYGPAPPHGEELTEEDKQAVDMTLYLRLLGLLMYLTKSRPEISTAVSFGATNSHNPLQYHYKELQYVVEFLRATPDDGLIIRASYNGKIQFYCQVDASYLLHKDSKGHTGYAIDRTDGRRIFLYPKFKANPCVDFVHSC